LPLTKPQFEFVRILSALIAAPPPQTLAEAADAHAKRARALAAVGRARLANHPLRAAACGVSALVAMSVVGNLWPIVWGAGLLPILFVDRALYRRLLTQCEAAAPPRDLRPLLAWTFVQSVFGNLLGALLWFSPYVPGETLAVIFFCGGLANAAATLRMSPALSIAAAGPTIAFLLALPVAEYLHGGARNPLDLMPLVGALLLLGFGVNLWRSLLASDAAQAQAEAAAIRERQAAASAAAAKTDMIRRMNDELRTPMAALIGAAEHLHRAAASPQARAHIATLVQAGEVLKLVLDDFSDLDRLENGHLRIDTRPADPREIVRGVVSAFRAAAQDKQLELFLDIGVNTPALVEIDALRVRQVLFNLLANAVRYTTHGGVRVRLTALKSQHDGRVRLAFVVADTGAGMSRSQLALIFGRGRVPAERDGPGLGLVISLRLAHLMGGQLQARSELGEGSAVTFMLDVAVVGARETSAA
jgi:signal transduction histidine kinase